MKIISMHKVDAAMEAGKLPGKELIRGMGQLMGEMRRAGAFLDGDVEMDLLRVVEPRPKASIRQHRDVIARFGRFPMRNEILGRQSTAEEKAHIDRGRASGSPV